MDKDNNRKTRTANHPESKGKTHKRFLTPLIISLTCVCGWFVMELEILGVRMLTPYFGSAIYVVTGSVIGIFLLSLSAGYMLGGWMSNRTHTERIIGINLTVAGAWWCVLPFFVDTVCEIIFNWALDEKWGSLIATLVLFGVPTMLLATVSPTVVRWLTRKPEDAGFNTGLVLTASTIAGFGGCVVTAFYLVMFSIRATICISGVVLIALGLFVLAYTQLFKRSLFC